MPSSLFARKHIVGAPGKVTNELMAKADRLTRRGTRLGSKYLVPILEESSDFPSVNEFTVHNILQFTWLRV
jgi:hypothetical protein